MSKAYHTCNYVYDTYSSGDKPCGKYMDSVGFYSAAETIQGLVKTADNAAFWDVANNNKGHYCRVITVDGNAI